MEDFFPTYEDLNKTFYFYKPADIDSIHYVKKRSPVFFTVGELKFQVYECDVSSHSLDDEGFSVKWHYVICESIVYEKKIGTLTPPALNCYNFGKGYLSRREAKIAIAQFFRGLFFQRYNRKFK